MEDLDPYKVFKVPRNFAIEDVKAKYKRLSLKLHPDRNPTTDTTRAFQAVSYCYQRLLEDYVARVSDRQHNDLKQAATAYYEPRQSTEMSEPQKFDLHKFNQVFSNHRIDDPNDVGYGEWMAKTPAERAAEEERKRTSVQMYRPMHLHTMDPNQAYELGTVAVNDFSRPVCFDSLGRRQKGLAYTDYRVAHTTTQLVDEARVQHREYKSVDDLETERANISYSMTEQDAAREHKERRREAARERAKVLAQQERDRIASDQYARLHKIMIGDARSR
jgi:curved DNA-binding protein CbpA